MSINLYELNKLAGAVLFALLVLLGTRTVSNIIFASHAPETPGYEIEVAEEPGKAGAKPEQKAEVPLANLLQTASAERGQKASRKCAACHTFNDGGASKVGPNLYNIVGSPLGHVEGFAYSPALKEKGGDWSFESLSEFIKAPRTYLPGTKMAFAGISRPQERADLILYLRDQSASPKALPEPADETAEAGETAEAAEAEKAEPAAAADAKPADASADKPKAANGADKPAAETSADKPKAQTGAGNAETGSAQAAEETGGDAAAKPEAPSQQ